MTDTNHSTSKPTQNSRWKLWPWVITSVVALLIALFLTVWIPQHRATDLLQRIDAAGGRYAIDQSGRPESVSFLNRFEYVELFDRVESLELPGVDPELFRDAVSAFKSLESLKFDLSNSADFDREVTARMTQLRTLRVSAQEPKHDAGYKFLAGCDEVTYLVLEGAYHDDRFWQYVPEMNSLSKIWLDDAGPELQGEGIPDLSKSRLEEVFIYGANNAIPEELVFRGFRSLLRAPRLRKMQISDTSIEGIETDVVKGFPPIVQLALSTADLHDRALPALSHFSSLDELYLSGNQIMGKSLNHLAAVPLNVLDLSENPLSEEGCRNLAKFDKVQELQLLKTQIRPQWLASWKNSPLSSNLQVLMFSSSETGDEFVDALMTFTKLKRLSIDESKCSNEAILKLADHPSLERLDVVGTVSNELDERFRKRVKEQGKIYPEIR